MLCDYVAFSRRTEEEAGEEEKRVLWMLLRWQSDNLLRTCLAWLLGLEQKVSMKIINDQTTMTTIQLNNMQEQF